MEEEAEASGINRWFGNFSIYKLYLAATAIAYLASLSRLMSSALVVRPTLFLCQRSRSSTSVIVKNNS